jgi:plastocyanin
LAGLFLLGDGNTLVYLESGVSYKIDLKGDFEHRPDRVTAADFESYRITLADFLTKLGFTVPAAGYVYHWEERNGLGSHTVRDGDSLASIAYHDVHHPIAVTDVPLESVVASTSADAHHVAVDNFSFSPSAAIVAPGATVTWTNHDDVPHNIVSTEKKFASPVLDTDQQFSHRFDASGAYPYFCSVHPQMTGQIVVA